MIVLFLLHVYKEFKKKMAPVAPSLYSRQNPKVCLIIYLEQISLLSIISTPCTPLRKSRLAKLVTLKTSNICWQGSQQNLDTWKTWRFDFYLSRSRNGLEFIPKKWENLDKTRNLAENLNKTWNAKIYKISILYVRNLFSTCCTPANCEHLWCLPVSAKICSHYNVENDFLTWTKPGDNLECYYLNKMGTLC